MFDPKAFKPETVLSDEDYAEFERVGGVQLDGDARAKLLALLHRYEAMFEYERIGSGQKLRKKIANSAEQLREVACFGGWLDGELPGHLWTNILADVCLDGDNELRNLAKVADALDKLNTDIEAVRNKRKRDSKIDLLLIDLSGLFHSAGGKSGFTNIEGKRTGRFLDFCRAVITRIPKHRRPNPEVGARWEKLWAELRKEGYGYFWPGKAPVFPMRRP